MSQTPLNQQMAQSLANEIKRLNAATPQNKFAIALEIFQACARSHLEAVEYLNSKCAEVLQILEAAEVLDPGKRRQLKVAAKQLENRSLRNAAQYSAAKNVAKAELGAWSTDRTIANLGKPTLKLLVTAWQQCGEQELTALLSRALIERFLAVEAARRGVVEPPVIKRADIWKVLQVQLEGERLWSYPPPTLELLRLIALSSSGVPHLAFSQCSILRQLATPDRGFILQDSPSLQPLAPSITSCSVSDLYENTATTITRLREENQLFVRRNGYLLITIEGIPPTPWSSHGIDSNTPVHSIISSKIKFGRPLRGGLLRGCTSSSSQNTIQFDPVQDPQQTSSLENDIAGLYERMRHTVRTGTEYAYYIREPTDDRAWINQILHCGKKLRSRPRMPGVNTTYHYVSLSDTTASAMHTEDAGLASLNLILAGRPKSWLVVSPLDQTKFETWIRGNVQRPTSCSQFVRHAAILVDPSGLEDMGIHYAIVEQHAGQLMYTETGAYHQVINLGTNWAIAVNFEGDDTPGVPEDYIFCSAMHGCASGAQKEGFLTAELFGK